ncbi:MAG: SDR family NAD(P)-dependent oxidoreductase, partial [Mycobacterium sp.]
MVGVYYNEYQSSSAGNPDTIDAYSATGNAHSVTVGRIAYLLGVKGPAVAMDTACSSSLVSIHLACQSLRMRESDLALAGGVSLSLRPETQLALAKWGMLSPNGKCHAFDSRADSFVRGKGAGVVVLKRLTDAVRDGDRVLGVVRGSAINQDGRSNGLTAPNAPSQRDVMTRALRSADVTAASVSYVETHGTGTSLGDPIEFDALAAVYGRGDAPCALGAVKTNMGHLEAAAGVAGFIKAVLTLQHGTIPPNLHFQKWNPSIDPSGTRLFVPNETAQWPQIETPRRAAVSSFGMGGTNAHIVLEQGPDLALTAATAKRVTTLVVSGKTPARLAVSATSLADWLADEGAAVPLGDVAFTVNHHRSRHHTIAAVCAHDHAEAVAGLRALSLGHPAPNVVPAHDTRLGSGTGNGTVFLYSGQGSQWAGMGKALLVEEPAFATAIDELEPTFVDKVGFSLRQVIEAGEPVIGIDRIQPVLVGMQLALTTLWRSYGVEAHAVIGHSMGEVTAAVVAGALTPAEGLDVIATRTRLMKRLAGQGAMALLELDATAAEQLIADRPDITIAVYASPKQSVIAGSPDQVDELVAIVDAQGKLARRIEVDVASHHPTIDPVLPELRDALAYLAPAAPKIPLISTVGYTGGAPLFSADYWAANLRNPVRFGQAVHDASAEHSNFIEISPHPLLTHAITDTLAAQSTSRTFHVGGTINRDHPESLAFHTQLATVQPPATEAPAGSRGRIADVPPTTWQHEPYWMVNRSAGGEFSGAHPLLGLHVELPSGSGHVWQSDVGLEAYPWLADHIVHGLPVMPGAGFAEITLAAGQEALDRPATEIEVEVKVEQMLPLDDHTKLTTQLIRKEGTGELLVEIHSRSDSGTWTRHASGTVRTAEPVAQTRLADSAADGTPVSPADFYTALRRTGAHHAHAFAALTRIVRSSGAAHTEIVLPDEATPHRGLALHPVMLDAALQGLAAAMSDEVLSNATDITFLPVGFKSIRVFGEIGRRARCRAELVSVAEDSGDAMGRVTLADEAGIVLAVVDGVHLKCIQRGTVPLPLSQKIFDTSWVESTVSASGSPKGSWLALADGASALTAADEFAGRFGGEQRRVLTAELGDENAVREAFGIATADPDLPPAGVVVIIDQPDFDGTDATGGLAHTRDVIWAVAGTVRAIVGSWHGKPPRLWLLTRGGLVVDDSDGPGNPGVGSLTGLVRVLAYEHPDLQVTLLDVGVDGDATQTLVNEIANTGSAGHTEDVVAWRSGTRYVERLSRAKLPAKPAKADIRGDSAYVVTGAFGGVGMAVVRWLVDNGAGRVVLNGRGAPSDEVQAVLDALSAHSEIVTALGDIAQPGVAERLVAAAEETGKPLRGLVHSAAVLDDELVVG